jgi:RNA polymerase sigma factor (sigma-70 family)
MLGEFDAKIRRNLYHYALQIVKNSSEAEVLVSDAITTVIEVAQSRAVLNLVEYAKTSVRNLAFRWLRRNRCFDKFVERSKVRKTRMNRSALEDVLGAESVVNFKKALRKLTAAQRKVIKLRVVQGLSHDEIAIKMGLKPGAVRALFFRAREAIKPLLDPPA